MAGIFKAGGGERVLFVCSSSACREGAEQKAKITRTLDLPAESLFAGDLGGVFDGRALPQHSARGGGTSPGRRLKPPKKSKKVVAPVVFSDYLLVVSKVC